MKPILIITGILSAVLITVQAVLGLLIRRGADPSLTGAHFHTGMLTAVITIVYVALSLTVILAKPRNRSL